MQPHRIIQLSGPVALLFTAVVAFVLLAAQSERTAIAAVAPSSFFTHFQHPDLVDQDGHSFDVAALTGKVTLVNFVFTQCSSTCSIQTAQLQKVYSLLPDSIGRETRFVSVSVDPLADTPQVLRDFADRMGIDRRNWSFVTGGLNSINSITTNLKLFGSDADNDPQNHSTALWLIDPTGHLVMKYRGVPVDVNRVSTELVQLHELHQ